MQKFQHTFWVTVKPLHCVLAVGKWILHLTVACNLYTQVSEEYWSPLQIKHAAFIFITGR